MKWGTFATAVVLTTLCSLATANLKPAQANGFLSIGTKDLINSSTEENSNSDLKAAGLLFGTGFVVGLIGAANKQKYKK